MTPLSTKMHVSRSPMARWMSSAATVESTPPLKPQTTRPSPTCARMRCRRFLDKRRHRPVAGAAADVVGEIPQDVETAIGVRDLRMEQQRVESLRRRRHRRDRRVGARRGDGEAWRRGGDEVAVAGPDAQIARNRREERRARLDPDRRQPELAMRRRRDCAAHQIGHQLHAVADAEHRHAALEHRAARSAARPASETLFGPPDRMMPAGLRRAISAGGVSNGRISE